MYWGSNPTALERTVATSSSPDSSARAARAPWRPRSTARTAARAPGSPTPTVARPVQWLRVGDMQLPLFLGGRPPAPRHHLGLTIDDFDAAYRAVKARTSEEWGWRLVELPSGQVRLYFHDPAGNLIELNWPDVGTLDRSRYPELRRLADEIPQNEDSDQAVLYLAGVG